MSSSKRTLYNTMTIVELEARATKPFTNVIHYMDFRASVIEFLKNLKKQSSDMPMTIIGMEYVKHCKANIKRCQRVLNVAYVNNQHLFVHT